MGATAAAAAVKDTIRRSTVDKATKRQMSRSVKSGQRAQAELIDLIECLTDDVEWPGGKIPPSVKEGIRRTKAAGRDAATDLRLLVQAIKKPEQKKPPAEKTARRSTEEILADAEAVTKRKRSSLLGGSKAA